MMVAHSTMELACAALALVVAAASSTVGSVNVASAEGVAFAPSTEALWAPKAMNASRVFLRAATAIALPAEAVSVQVIVSSLPDFDVGGDGRTPNGKTGQRLLAAYRLFVNGVEVAHGPGRGRQPTNPNYWADVVSDMVTLDSSLAAAGELSLAMQCFQASPTAGTDGWAMLELRTFDSSGNLLTTYATNTADKALHGQSLSWMAWNADPVFEYNSGIPDTAGRLNENLDAGALARVVGWREANYVPTADAGWVAAEGRTPRAPPVPKITKPLEISHGQQPVQVIKLGSNHWFVDFGHEAMSGIELTVPAAISQIWIAGLQNQAQHDGTGASPCSSSPQKCSSHPGITYCPSNHTPGQCETPMPHNACPACPRANAQLSIRMSEQLCHPPGNQWNKCPKPYTVLYPMSSRNKFESVLTLAEYDGNSTGGVDSVFEHHEYPGLWRYAEIKLGTFPVSSLSFSNSSGTTSELNYQDVTDGEVAAQKIETVDALPFNFSRWVVKYPFNVSESSFVSSSPMLNNVWKLCRDTLRHTSLDTFTDSNTRERLPYEADGFITARSRWALQAELAWPNHSIQHVLVNPTWPTEWKQFMIMLIYEHWMQSGDVSLAGVHFEHLVNNTMLPFINPVTQLVDWSGHQNVTGNQCYRKYCSKDDKLKYDQTCTLCHLSSNVFPEGVTDGGCSCDNPDWQPSYRAGFVFTNVNTVINAFAVKSMLQLSEMAAVLGKTIEAAMLSKQANQTKVAMLSRMYNNVTGLWCDGICGSRTCKQGTGCTNETASTSFHSQHYTLWLGITPDEGINKTRASALSQTDLGPHRSSDHTLSQILCSDVLLWFLLTGLFSLTDLAVAAVQFLKPMGMNGSVYTAHSLIHGLFDRAAAIDDGQAALDLMTQCTGRSWCNMLANNATTSWVCVAPQDSMQLIALCFSTCALLSLILMVIRRRALAFQEMWGATEGTHSHPWSTTPSSAIASGLMGVRPTVPGWKKWIVKPAPGNLTHALIVVPTMHGLIHARLNGTHVRGRFELGLKVPPGTEATACVRKTAGRESQGRLLLNGVDITSQAVMLKVSGSWGYACIEGLTPRGEDAEHVLLRTA